jgi:hypothetical protein
MYITLKLLTTLVIYAEPWYLKGDLCLRVCLLEGLDNMERAAAWFAAARPRLRIRLLRLRDLDNDLAGTELYLTFAPS